MAAEEPANRKVQEPDDTSKPSVELSESEEEDKHDPSRETIVRAKWLLDGCKSIDDIIARLQQQMEEFNKMKQEGWELSGSVDDDYGFMHKR